MAKVITVTSGKGGVGKTSISLNLSLSLASSGFRVCLFDADLGLANVNILTGLFPEKGLEQVISGNLSLDEIMIKDFHGIDIIPGSSGVEKMADLSLKESDALIKAFLNLKAYDYFIFDTSAGISSQVLSFCMASHEMVLVVTPEPTSLTDAYSLLKVLAEGRQVPSVKVVVNQVKTRSGALKAWSKLKETVLRFLSIPISPLGIVAHDKSVYNAVISQVPFVILSPESLASKCVESVARKLVKGTAPGEDIPMELFWHQRFKFFNSRKTKGTRPGAKKDFKADKAVKDHADARALDYSSQLSDLKKGMSRIDASISQLVDQVAGIKELKEELAGIRTLLAGWGNPPLEGSTKGFQDHGFKPEARAKGRKQEENNMPKVNVPVPKPGKIYLDFEAWMKKRSS